MRGRFMGALLLAACGASDSALVPEAHIEGDSIPRPLVRGQADVMRGEAIFVGRDRGHCVLCHQVASLSASFQGSVGPDLSEVGAVLTPGQIRLRIVDASRLNPDTIMPPYYRIEGLTQVASGYEGKPALSGEEIEHLVAYLSDLKG